MNVAAINRLKIASADLCSLPYQEAGDVFCATKGSKALEITHHTPPQVDKSAYTFLLRLLTTFSSVHAVFGNDQKNGGAKPGEEQPEKDKGEGERPEEKREQQDEQKSEEEREQQDEQKPKTKGKLPGAS